MNNAAQEKSLPQNIDAEISILGALILDNEAISTAIEALKEDDFYKLAHRQIYLAITQLYDSGGSVDIVTLSERLRKLGLLDQVGGVAYITTLLDFVSTSANIAYYIEIIKEKAVLRKLIHSSSQIIQDCYSQQDDVENLLDSIEKTIFNVTQSRISRDFVSIRDLVNDSIGQIEKNLQQKNVNTGIPSGFVDFDKMTSGLHPSDLLVLAARPSMGKTAFALNIAEHVAVHEKKKVAFFSLEMAADQLVLRILCSHARINIHKVRGGFLKSSDMGQLVAAAGEVSSSSIFIDDTPGMTLMEIRAKSRRLALKHGIDLILIDYLQLIAGSTQRRQENRQQEISEISRSLKNLARELNIPVIVLSQLNRDVESRDDHKPRLSDLRESGAIEQDADMVVMLMRKDYYNQEDEPGIADVIIAKHRNGPVGEFKLSFNKECARFNSISFYDPEA